MTYVAEGMQTYQQPEPIDQTRSAEAKRRDQQRAAERAFLDADRQTPAYLNWNARVAVQAARAAHQFSPKER